MSGRFVVFEGGEGCGKSTQAALLADRLGAVLTRQPGGTEIGAALRTILLDPATAGLTPRTEALLMAADRAQHVAEVIRPALADGHDVVCDRYLYSSIAYQGHGRGLTVSEVRDLSGWATEGLLPDLVVLLTVPADLAATRLGSNLDRFESAGEGFHERVATGFAELAAGDPERFVVIDGSAPVDVVAAQVWAAVEERLT